MPQSRFERLMFALITVIITVPCFVFYCSSVKAGGFTIDVIKENWIYIPIELVLAYLCEIFVGSPMSMKMAFKAVNPKRKQSIFNRNSYYILHSYYNVSINELFSNNSL